MATTKIQTYIPPRVSYLEACNILAGCKRISRYQNWIKQGTDATSALSIDN